MLDNVLTYKRSNARVSHRVIERVSKYKHKLLQFQRVAERLVKLIIPRYMYLKV